MYIDRQYTIMNIKDKLSFMAGSTVNEKGQGEFSCSESYGTYSEPYQNNIITNISIGKRLLDDCINPPSEVQGATSRDLDSTVSHRLHLKSRA